MKAPKRSAPDSSWLRPAVLAVAAAGVLLGLFHLVGAATTWTSLPANPVVIAYFTITLVVVPLLSLWAFVLAWQDRRLTLAAALAGVQPVVFLVRSIFLGGA